MDVSIVAIGNLIPKSLNWPKEPEFLAEMAGWSVDYDTP